MAAHQQGEVAGYTHARRPVRLAFAEEFPSRVDALERERQIKGWKRNKKEALIRGDWAGLVELGAWRWFDKLTTNGYQGLTTDVVGRLTADEDEGLSISAYNSTVRLEPVEGSL